MTVQPFGALLIIIQGHQEAHLLDMLSGSVVERVRRAAQTLTTIATATIMGDFASSTFWICNDILRILRRRLRSLIAEEIIVVESMRMLEV